MPFTPVIPLNGFAGWRVLERTMDRQVEAFNKSADIQREIEYFRENMPNALTSEDLLSDRKLLKVALGAFGLQDEINKGGLIRKVLDEGTLLDDTFANRLNNSQYIELAEAFSYGNGGLFVSDNFINQVVDKYLEQSFEEAVGTVNNDMRLSLNFQRQITELASSGESETTLWFRVLGNVPLRTVFETAYGLPSEFSQLDVDQQVRVLEEKTEKFFGTSSIAEVFADSNNIDDMIRRFQVRRDIESGPGPTTPGYAGLLALQSSSGIGSFGAQNLFLSNL
jgi:hypothetical protein